MKRYLPAIVLFIVGVLLGQTIAAVAGINLFPDRLEKTEEPGLPADPAAIDLDYLNGIVSALSADTRNALLSDADAFGNFVQSEATNLSLLKAAHESKLEDDDKIKMLMARGAKKILVESYLNLLLQSNVKRDFPNDQQIRTYYDENKDKFLVNDRLHLWQVYLSTRDAADDKAAAEIKKQATVIHAALNEGKLDFSAAAARYSEHEPSRLNGGYMGLLQTKDLLPEVQKAVEALKEGQISTPIETADGVHIVKRGALVRSSILPFDDVKERVKLLLAREHQVKVRDALIKKIEETYPNAVSKTQIDEWRRQLAADFGSNAT